jgi:hypothetical protein
MTLKAVEEAIQEARRRGEFDNLPGHGKPLDHTEYFSHPEEYRIAAHLLKNSGFVPPEVELMRERGELTTLRAQATDPRERVELQRRIDTITIKLEVMKRAAR